MILRSPNRLNLFRGLSPSKGHLPKRLGKWLLVILIPGLFISIIRWGLHSRELKRSLHQTQVQWQQWQEIIRMNAEKTSKAQPLVEASLSGRPSQWTPLLWSVGRNTSRGVRVRKLFMGHSEETKAATAPLIEIEAEAKTLIDIDHWISRLNWKPFGIEWVLDETIRSKGEFPLVFKIHGKT